MAFDQKTSTIGIESGVPGSVIENELPTYRAISNLAIFSVVCGLLAIFCWAHYLFYLAAVLAVVLGMLAHRAIRRFPDMLTGHGLANAGIALGLIFGLGSGTFSTVQYFVRTRLAETFAKHYAETVQSAGLADVLTLHLAAGRAKTGRTRSLKKQIRDLVSQGAA